MAGVGVGWDEGSDGVSTADGPVLVVVLAVVLAAGASRDSKH